MPIRVSLHHDTLYRYDRPVTLSPHVIRLRPAPHCRTPIISYSIRVEPKDQFFNWQQDPYSNWLGRVVFLKPARELKVTVDLVAEMTAINPFDFFVEASAEKYPFTYDAVLAKELTPYLEAESPGPKLAALLKELQRSNLVTVDYLVEINRVLQERIGYLIRMEPGVQTCEVTLTKRSGSCRDSAWLLVQVLRNLGIAARFASGYLIQLTSDVKPLVGPAGPDEDFTDLHAWAEAYLPGAGWIGLDPTSGLLAGEGHIPLACTAAPQTAAPVSGSFAYAKSNEDDECDVQFHFAMSVSRVHEDPRVTKPYSDHEWNEIDALGRRVDADLREHDVRLTMGGEPTFVSVDDRDAAEWNTDALGPTKRRIAGDLMRRLRDRFGPGALLHFGQGKWYPGESLPRWALGCYWRRDGVPIWEDPELVAREDRSYGCGPEQADRFTAHLAVRLGVNPANALPGFEDAWYYLWRERRLPVNVDPLESNLDDPEERARLARVFEKGLGTVVGYTLPLRRGSDGRRPIWESGRWFLRQEHLYLIPGDSPMGYRLPLDSLPWVAPEVRDVLVERDPFHGHPPLPERAQLRFQPWLNLDAERAPPLAASHPDHVVRTALCVEPRDGRLYVFMPPQRTTEDYLELVHAVEATAAELGLPVLIEGYTPPFDPRLNVLKVTPDPGVIEVNLHPARSWRELVENTNALYEEAHRTRLTTEKFMLDGRHIGTGGGNHVVMGGPTPADSPILRRPDLLRSLLGYWINHPSLSFLFSGLFVGPTSQAPRIDEARNDSLYELELAGRQIADFASVPSWLTDRLFRNLLIDASGNTHRTEFSIDKLFSPDSTSGRLGLVEFRGFEMPPHERMSLVQQLLLRGLIARFWKKPYSEKMVRWGTELHDRFMLPHYVWRDFSDVLDDLSRAGYPMRENWFAPHFEFRFAPIGSVTYRDINMELRQAIEPWHVLGEEAGGGGTVRYVDSSLERLQVKVNGMTGPRHVVVCNGRRIPLRPTGVRGEFVGGVRFRAWQPPSCLQPTIPVHAPLVFDLLDIWSGRSIGGCTYHVSHPGGRSHERLPVNTNEAEGRRTARFFPIGHTPGPMAIPPDVRSDEFPHTLDLRQPIGCLPVQGKPAGAEERNGDILSARREGTVPIGG